MRNYDKYPILHLYEKNKKNGLKNKCVNNVMYI